MSQCANGARHHTAGVLQGASPAHQGSQIYALRRQTQHLQEQRGRQGLRSPSVNEGSARVGRLQA